MAGHRRISTRLFLRYRDHPQALAVLLSIDLDAARGRILSARAYERTLGCSRRLATRLLQEYAAFRHELEPKSRRAAPSGAKEQRSLPLLAMVRGKRYHHLGRHDDTTFAEGNPMVPEKAGHEVRQECTTSEIQSESVRARSRASEPEALPEPEHRGAAYYRAVRAARALLRREGVRFPPLALVEARAKELGAEQIEQALGA